MGNWDLASRFHVGHQARRKGADWSGTVTAGPNGTHLVTNRHGMTAVHVTWHAGTGYPPARGWHDPAGLILIPT